MDTTYDPVAMKTWDQTPKTMWDAIHLLKREFTVVEYRDTPFKGNAQVKLPNGWTVSLAMAVGSYCGNRPDFMMDPDEHMRRFNWALHASFEALAMNTPTCEVAIFKPPDDDWYECPDDPDQERVWGWISAPDVLKIVDAVGTVQFHGRCVCPRCVLGDEEDTEVCPGCGLVVRKNAIEAGHRPDCPEVPRL